MPTTEISPIEHHRRQLGAILQPIEGRSEREVRALEAAENIFRKNGFASVAIDMSIKLGKERKPAVIIALPRTLDTTQASLDFLFDPEVVLLANNEPLIDHTTKAKQYRSKMVRILSSSERSVMYSVNRQSDGNEKMEDWKNIVEHPSYEEFKVKHGRLPNMGETMGLAVDAADVVFDMRKLNREGKLRGPHLRNIVYKRIQ